MWQPIETAPKNRLILLYRPTAVDWGKVTPGRWNSAKFYKKPKPYWEIWFRIGGAREARAWRPTHWMELPEPPLGG